MKCEEFEIAITDYLDKKVDDDTRQAIEHHRSACERCREVLHEQELLFNLMANTKMEQPDETLKINFYYMLQSEMNKQNPLKVSSRSKTWGNRNLSFFLKVAAGFVLVVIGAFAGSMIYDRMNNGGSSASNNYRQNEDAQLLAQLNQESPGQRIKAVSYIENNTSEADTKMLATLVDVLNNDENVNVRMAAAYTLSKFIDTPLVRDAMVESLGKQTEPLLQILLMNILTEKKELKAIEPMQKIITNKNSLEQVKFAAQKNINVLL
jgi:hypothetical protein